MTTVNFIVEPGQECSVEAKAYSKDKAGIFITAPDMQTAQGMVKQGEQMARDALEAWEPVKEKPAERTAEHYILPPVTQEQAGRDLSEYEQTAAGSRMRKSIDNAAAFTAKKDKSPLRFNNVLYFALLSYKEGIYDAITKMYMYAFRKGYNSAKRGA